MPLLHETHHEIRHRFAALTPGARRAWGTMSIDQMLWHVSQTMEMAIGRRSPGVFKAPPLPGWMLKFVVMRLPWPRGVPTGENLVARQPYDFAEEHARTLRLIDEVVARPLDGPWPLNEVFGAMSGRDWSHLQHKHLDHHLRQFSA